MNQKSVSVNTHFNFMKAKYISRTYGFSSARELNELSIVKFYMPRKALFSSLKSQSSYKTKITIITRTMVKLQDFMRALMTSLVHTLTLRIC